MWRAAALVTAMLAGDPAKAACRQALALGLDVSGSVDSPEYALQRRGLANALRHPEVTEALLALPQAPVELMVYEWSAPGAARVILPWTAITAAAVLESAANRIATAPRTGLPSSTALGAAMRFGITALAPRPCWRRTLDLSGDGKSNTGPPPAPVRAEAAAAGITINALVIGADAPATGDARYVEIGELTAYFRFNVIAGPGAFTEPAFGFSDYEAAMVRKLKRELEGLVVSRR
ncbi:DUF1194 domain-containing protein [Marimonas arenosa]|uniref:DUF1194 domain-containing protein n=1 Tax=Marimonas arenosa TaxID=1795305 RepID=A0AAE4B4C2_9RHOB|nr:DUF1194 domain-containing protein [Marimonas arenosa]MDQ2089254.1 DUF1194 domain-containing protein [Marimonas arenosa]